jgi:hypothetical protein
MLVFTGTERDEHWQICVQFMCSYVSVMYGKYCCPLLVIASRILYTIFNVNVTGYLSLFCQLIGRCVCSVRQVARAGRVFALLHLPVLC